MTYPKRTPAHFAYVRHYARTAAISSITTAFFAASSLATGMKGFTGYSAALAIDHSDRELGMRRAASRTLVIVSPQAGPIKRSPDGRCFPQ